MREVLDYYMPKIKKSKVLEKLRLSAGKYFLVSMHREENIDSTANLQDLLDSLSGLADAYQLPVIVSTHPRTQKRIDGLKIGKSSSRIRFLKPFGFCDYVKLQMGAKCVISDSGTITEESSLLNLPAITVRNTHERPEGMDVGTLIMSGLKKESVLDAISITLAQCAKKTRVKRAIEDYESVGVAEQILKIVLSYTGYVNRTVWRQS